MYRERGFKSEVSSVDRKRINDALDKQLERSSPSTSRAVGINGRDKQVLMGKTTPPPDQRDSRPASLSKTNCSDGWPRSLHFFFLNLNDSVCSILMTLLRLHFGRFFSFSFVYCFVLVCVLGSGHIIQKLEPKLWFLFGLEDFIWLLDLWVFFFFFFRSEKKFLKKVLFCC